ncbi:MAG: Periplasmic component of the Tol biopolymer transport system [Capsulimonas sp.]|nr:Periplasmic component of the Tol biopolymer transport system [Capsulimonas sp.]
MNAQRHLRIATIASIFLFLVLAGFALFAGTTQSIAARGNTGNALAYRIASAGKVMPKTLKSVLPTNGHRYVYNLQDYLSQGKRRTANSQKSALVSTVSISEPVQTFDISAPPPAFTPVAAGLTSENDNATWSSDEQNIVFSSNRPSTVATDPVGRFHLWTSSADGSNPTQLTSGSGNEYEPALSSSGSLLAFTSDASDPASGVRDLYIVTFAPAAGAVKVSTLQSVTVKSGVNPGFSNVNHPSWAASQDRLVFSALTTTGSDKNHYHIYYLYTATLGYYLQGQGTGVNPPGKLTAGLEDDRDPAWSPDGHYLLFSSNSAGFVNTGTTFNPVTQTTPSASSAIAAHRSLFLLTTNGNVPSTGNVDLTATGGRVTNSTTTDEGPSWAFASSDFAGYIAFGRLSPTVPAGASSHYDVYYMRLVTNLTTGAVTTESASPAIKLDTSDPKNIFDDRYPTWSPLRKHYSIAYQSNRSVTYNGVDGAPLEVVRSIPDGSENVGSNYVGILVSEITKVDPPTLIEYSGDEVIHTSEFPQTTTTRFVHPGQRVTFTVRLSNRLAGLDDNNIYLQIKDPDSKYQDSQQLEHKLFTTDFNYAVAHPDLYNVNAATFLYNGGFGNDFFTINNVTYSGHGALGGRDGDHFITIGRSGGGANPFDPGLPGSSPATYIPGGQEYECQVLNPLYTGVDTVPADYSTPAFLPGVDDVLPGSAPTPSKNWLKLTKAATQDNLGGVLYTVTWKTPVSPSDYYLDVIAYDKASNWRIFDNIWGFTTQSFNGNNKILVVSDYALGQKFVASAFGRNGGFANATPLFYGAESYFTDVDVDVLPNAAYETAIGKINTGGKDPTSTKDPVPMVIDFGYRGQNDPQNEDITGFGTVENALGVQSEDPTTLTYDIWRILSRGPVVRDTLLGYAPSNSQLQPAVTKLGQPAARFAIAEKCVVWLSPYTGDLLVGPGTLRDQATQALIAEYMDKGGRIFVTGQNVASAVTEHGSINNPVTDANPSFIAKYLGATYLGAIAQSDILASHANVANVAKLGHRASYDGHFNTNVGFPRITSVNDNGIYFFDNNTHPSDFPLILNNSNINPGNGRFLDFARTEASLDQHIAVNVPSLITYGNGGSFSEASASIDTIKPNADSNPDILFTPPVAPDAT